MNIRWLLHHLHQRRQGMRGHDSGLLRVLRVDDEGRLHLLHDDERHAGVLLLSGNRSELKNQEAIEWVGLSLNVDGPALFLFLGKRG